MSRLLKTGEGWRIGWDENAAVYRGLVGGEDWAIELTEAEFQDFCRLFAQLAQTMQEMAAALMDEERIACAAESDLLWLEVEGFPAAYELRLIVNSGRRCEGNWPPAVVPELLQGARSLQIF
ncbi:MAG: DUF1818 family protein [Jaaginema sp. PMC 1079.18]|nr:DUF1818 family protein [Jaaginema sp. PMC 1080.18]MEC4851247.1 DUF1818 family protein [Jaaginema sp. PMC 1079.18]MEC4866410.1 DUF1818 family protein [Jaaginema sp. PMC 1078.18]